MPGIVIKNVPSEVHRRLKETAARNQRSLTQEALLLLEQGLERSFRHTELPPPFKGRFPLTSSFVDKAKRQGRA